MMKTAPVLQSDENQCIPTSILQNSDETFLQTSDNLFKNFIACHSGKILYNPTLTKHNNASITTILSAEPTSTQTKYCWKFPRTLSNIQTDSIMADNVNGYIITKIAAQLNVAPTFMKYVDSFMAKVILDKEGRPTHYDVNGTGSVSIMTNISEDIPLPSIKKTLTDLIYQGNFPCDAYKRFVYNFSKMGYYAGFQHNDLHMGNLLYSKDGFVVIDYGRSTFTTAGLNNMSIIVPSLPMAGGNMSIPRTSRKHKTHVQSIMMPIKPDMSVPNMDSSIKIKTPAMEPMIMSQKKRSKRQSVVSLTAMQDVMQRINFERKKDSTRFNARTSDLLFTTYPRWAVCAMNLWFQQLYSFNRNRSEVVENLVHSQYLFLLDLATNAVCILETLFLCNYPKNLVCIAGFRKNGNYLDLVINRTVLHSKVFPKEWECLLPGLIVYAEYIAFLKNINPSYVKCNGQLETANAALLQANEYLYNRSYIICPKDHCARFMNHLYESGILSKVITIINTFSSDGSYIASPTIFSLTIASPTISSPTIVSPTIGGSIIPVRPLATMNATNTRPSRINVRMNARTRATLLAQPIVSPVAKRWKYGKLSKKVLSTQI